MEVENIRSRLAELSIELEDLRAQMGREAEAMLKLQSQFQLAEGRMLEISEKLDLKIIEYMQLEKEIKQYKNRSLCV